MFSCRRVHCLSVPLILVLFVWAWSLPGATELQAAGARNDWDAYVQDSLLTLAADANFPAEPTIQDILDNLGYNLNAETDALELDLFCLFPQSQWTLIAEYSGAADTHELGWYVPQTPGDSATVITGAMIPGDEVTLTGTENGNQGIFHRRDSGTAWFTEQALNYDGIVHHKAYPLPDGDGYIIFWEDLGWVTDADYNDMVVEVRPQNQAPFISVGFAKACSVCPPEYICEGDSVCLEIQVSDPGCFGDTVTLEMIEGDGTFVPVTGVAPYTAIHCWVPIWAGTKYFVFRATDNLGLTDEKEFWANVAFDHDPPVLPPPATLDVTACLPTEVCVDFPIEDDSYTELWIEPIGWYDDLLQRVCFDADTAGSYELSVIAADTCGNADTTLLTVNVTTTSPPVVTAGPDVEVELCGPDSLCVEFSVFDPDFDVVSITTDAPGIINLSDSTLCYVADGPGTVELPIYVLDACGYADTALVTFTVTSGSPLSLECPPSVETLLCEGGMVCFPITYTGGTGEVLVTVAPDGHYNIETGEVCFPVGSAGDYNVTVTVTDDCGSDESVVPLSVTMNTPPVVELVYDPPTLVCEEIDTVCVQFTCSDIDDNLTSCEVIAAPPGYWIQDNSVCFEVAEDGISTVTVEATDSCGATDINTVEIESHFNSAPEITVEESIDIGLCGPDEVCFPVEIADVDGNLESVIVTGGVYDEVNGEVCFSADQDGDYVITITAVDECQVETVRTVTVTVTLSVPVEITCPDPYEDLLCAPGPVCLPFVLPAFNGGLQVTVEPVGTYDDINEQICFDADTSGVYLLTVIAADTCGGADTCTVTATIDINELPDIVAESGTVFDLCMPEEICFPVSCTDPDNNLLICELISGPGTFNGMSICFTPTESGRVYFVMRATDVCGANREVQIYVDVTINDRPTITAPTVKTAFLCEPDFVCVDFSASDPEGGPVTVTSSIGEVDGSTLCVYFDADTDVCAELIATDTCGNADTATVCFEVDLNDKPVVTVDDAFDFALCAPGPICFPVGIVEEYIRTTSVSPIGVYDNGVVCFDADTSGIYEFKIVVMDTCLVSDTAMTTVTVEVNSSPVLTVPAETEIFTCSLDDQVCVTGITVDDAEGNLDTVELTGGVGLFNLSAGELCFDPDTVGYYCFELTAADDCGAVDVEAFCVQVTLGEAPVITLEPTINVVLPAPGNVCFDVGSDDPDLDQLFDLELLAGIGNFPTIDGRNAIAAEHCFDADTAGYYSFIFSSTDSCGLFDIESTVVLVDIVPPDTSFRICIDTLEAMNGRNIDVNVVVYESMVMGGFDLLICFDHTVLAFNHVTPGPAIEEWEYFTYRATSPDGCVGTCDVTAIRLFAIADMNDGASHPSEEAFTPVGIIATMNF